MSDNSVPAVGEVGWIDLTVPNADAVRDFYQHVTGWTATPFSMGEYSDYCMTPPTGDKPVAGVCHARGANADLPPVWIIYIMVADLDESIARCLERGGKLLSPERTIPDSGRYCIIQDPAGAIAGLFQGK